MNISKPARVAKSHRIPEGVNPMIFSSCTYFKAILSLTVFLLFNIPVILAQSDRIPYMPMQIDKENSLETTWLNKKIIETRLLDDMENLSQWSKSGNTSMTISSERSRTGNSSLRFTFPALSPAGSGSYPSVSVRKRFDGEDWSEYNRLSVWIYPELENAEFVTLALMLFNDGEIKVPDSWGRTGRHDVILETGKWNHVVWEIPFLAREKITGLAFVNIIAGKIRSGIADTGYFDIDLLELQKVDADHYEGWNVAPGKIAYSHSGYQTGGKKTAIMGDPGASEFSLINTETGKSILNKKVQKITTHLESFNLMDFSEVNIPGTYIIEAGGLSTRPFRIGDEVWKESIWKTINYWYCQRCGQTIDGVHDACHRDVTSRLDSLQIVVNGGWHDAGDLTQMIYNTAPTVFAMFSLADMVAGSDKLLSERLIEEGLWGLEWLLKTRFGNGYRHNFGGISKWTDGIIGSHDDFKFRAQNTPYENFLSASAIARAAISLRKLDPVRADECTRAAKEDWEAAVEKTTKHEVEICGEAIIASLNLFELTGDEKYAQKAIEWGNAIINSQQQSYTDWKIPLLGFFYRDSDKKQILRYNPIAQDQAPIMALSMLCKAFPQHEQWIEWYSAITLHSEYLKAVSSFSMPYGMIPQSVYNLDEKHERSLYGLQQSSLAGKGADAEYVKQVRNGMELGKGYYLRFFPVWYGHRGNFGIQLAQAKALAVGSHIRKDLEGINISRMQLEWIVGKNPFCQSTMWGEGYDFSPLYTPSSGHIVGGLPVGIQTSEDKDLPFWPSSACYNYKEIWSNPSARWLWLMEDVAFPARIRVADNYPSDLKIEISDKNSNQTREITSGEAVITKSGTIPEGNYLIKQDGKEKEVILLPGDEYSIEPDKFLSYNLSWKASSKRSVLITLKAEGTENSSFEIRGWNLKIPENIKNTGTFNDKTVTLTWKATVTDPGKPWIAVVVPDGNVAEMKELCNIKMVK